MLPGGLNGIMRLDMYVCMYACIYVCMYVYIYIYILAWFATIARSHFGSNSDYIASDTVRPFASDASGRLATIRHDYRLCASTSLAGSHILEDDLPLFVSG